MLRVTSSSTSALRRLGLVAGVAIAWSGLAATATAASARAATPAATFGVSDQERRMPPCLVEEPRPAGTGPRPSCDPPLMRQLLTEAQARRHLADLRAAACCRAVEERVRLGLP